MSLSPPPKIKKVRPYPFSVQVQGVHGVLNGQVQLITPKGFLADIEGAFLKVGGVVQVQMVLPVLDVSLVTAAKIFKSSDQYVHPGADKPRVVRRVEFLFQGLATDKVEAIRKFMSTIKQK